MMTTQEREDRVHQDLIRAFRDRASRDGRLVLIGNMVLLALAVVLFHDDVPGLWAYEWAGAVFALTLVRVAWHRRAARPDVTDRDFLRGMHVVLALKGLTWGVGVALMMPWLQADELAILLAGLAGICGIALSTLAADSPSFRILIAGMVGPLPFGLLATSTDKPHVVMAVLVVAGAVAMMSVHHKIQSGLVGHLRTVVRLRASEEAQATLIAELRGALASVKTLTGLLPICARCKKVRDDMGYWGSVERYISQHTDAKFSHGVCPDCFPKLFPGIPMPELEEEHV